MNESLCIKLCPKCNLGIIHHVKVYMGQLWYGAYRCNKCDYGYWEPVIDAKIYTVSTEGTADQFAKDISEMSDEEVKENTKKYFLDRQADMKYAIDTGTAYTITAEDYRQSYLLEKAERERLIKKLEKIDNLSRYAWEQVKRNPQEAEELFKMINKESK